ncbi:Homeobox protein 31 [Tripterygium wilfordii]|uniref:Homeobox protein 31 n=1 Tax=Tripterygium wilfordii TaxID=458696 RepID=A0A7J7CC91_TRIWF|nr:zinc-finger homeodomain protein 3-like [Tripterygium wilfordii]KAF5731794.1 Homeobox protein 31 [Tripterygium wilfordii]
MELSSQEGGDIPVPINTAFSVGHMIYHHDHHHIPNSSNGPSIPTSLNNHHHDHSNNNNVPYKKVVRYRECLKNHAATMGGNATDGCGEFMPSGEEGTIEAITCAVCNCHRNFHRKEVEGEPSSSSSWVGRKLLLGQPYHHHHKNLLGHETPLLYPTVISSRAAPTPHQMIMSYNNNNVGSMLPSESDEQEDIGGGGGGGRQPYHHHHLVKKRFRTKFTQEQKEKMLSFAEKVGWKIQKQEQSVIQQFCQEIGIKRKVLKVWMHNNKHNLAKKINDNNNPTVIAPTTTTTTTTSHS